MPIRVPVLLDISGDADVDFDRAITGSLRGVDTRREGDRLGRDFGQGFDQGASSTLGQALTAQGSAIARIGTVATGLVGALVPIGPSLAGVAAGALAVAGALAQTGAAALSAGGVLAALGQAQLAVQVGSAGVSDAISAQAAAQEELARTGSISTATQEELTAAMDGLAPAARDVVGVIGELTPAWSAFQNSVQQELFQGLASQLSEVSGSILPNLTTNLTTTASILNAAASSFATFITSGGGAEQINTIMAGLNLTLQALLPALGEIGRGLLTLFTGSVGSATSLAAAVSNVTRGFAGWAEGVVQSGALRDALAAAQTTLGSLFGIVGNIGSILVTVLGAGAEQGQSLLSSFEAVTGQLAAFLQTASANQGLQQFYGLIQQVAATAGLLGAVLGPIFTGVGTILATIIPIVEQLRAALEPVITALAVNLSTAVQGLAPVLGLVLGVVAQLVAALAPLVTLILNALGPAIAEIGALFSANLSPAITSLIALLQPLIGIFLEIFGAQVVNAITLVVDVLGGVIDVLGGLINFLVGVFTGDWDQAWQGLVQIAEGVVDILTGIVGFLWRTIQNYFRNGGQQVLTAVRNWWNGVVTSFTSFQVRVLTGVLAWVTRVVNGFLNLRNRGLAFVRALWSTAQTVFSNGVSRLATIAGTGLGRVVNLFLGLPGRISRAVGNLGSLLYNAGRNVVQGLINGINAMIGAVASAASNLAGTIRDYLPFSPAKEGPLSGSGNPENSGRVIAQMVADGILANMNAPANAMNQALAPLVANATGARTAAQGSGVRDSGVTVNQIFNGPTTSGGRLAEMTWNIRYATQSRTEVIGGVPE